ncbi:MAG: hypothetical protein WCC60_16400 [Ilumatobacteraceae bacterium]
MGTVRVLAAIPIAALLLGACSDDAASPATEAPTTTLAAAATTLSMPASTTVDTAVADDSSAGEPLSGPVQIDVVVGADSGENRIERVTVGAEITLNITNPDTDDEFHVHGIELEQSVAAGEMATFNFTVDAAGTYEVESHLTEDVLVVIEAS